MAAAVVLGEVVIAEEFQQYISPSIRICACVLLHGKGYSSVFINDRLCWRSDTSMDYLRDTPRLACKHADSLSQPVYSPEFTAAEVSHALMPTSA